MSARRIWIEEGCISCNLCEDLCPEVFHVPLGETCIIKGDALRQAGDPKVAEQLEEARVQCPVEVIQVS
jgi:ferredoxin